MSKRKRWPTMPKVEPPKFRNPRCAEDDVDPELFFVEKGQIGFGKKKRDEEYKRLTNEAKKFCRACGARVSCLEYALQNRMQFGVWGGMTVEERRSLLRERRTAV